MSASAFDVMMSAARAVVSKKKQPPEDALHKKRKTPESDLTQNPSSNAEIHHQTEPSNRCIRPSLASSFSKAELKERVLQLKKKPSEFDPISVVWWKKGESVPFLFLSLAFDMIDKESSRIAMTDIVCNLFRSVMNTTPEDLCPVVFLSANRIAPPHQGLELGIGKASIIKAIAEACGGSEKHINQQYKVRSFFGLYVVTCIVPHYIMIHSCYLCGWQSLGDLGLVVKAIRLSQSTLLKHDALTITQVFNTFRCIAKVCTYVLKMKLVCLYLSWKVSMFFKMLAFTLASILKSNIFQSICLQSLSVFSNKCVGLPIHVVC